MRTDQLCLEIILICNAVALTITTEVDATVAGIYSSILFILCLANLRMLIFFSEPFMCFDCELKKHGTPCGEPFDYTVAYQARLPMIQCTTSCIKWVRKDKRGMFHLPQTEIDVIKVLRTA